MRVFFAGMKRHRLVVVGAGSRGWTYARLAAALPDRFEIVGVVDPVEARRMRMAELARAGDFASFETDDALWARGRFADAVIIATPDALHVDPARKALDRGYDVLLEKPIARTPEEVVSLAKTAAASGRRVVVCHVLRYTTAFRKIRELVRSGTLGVIRRIEAVEGIGRWHFAHSYVRGHWACTSTSTPTILAKCCHDLDLLAWIAGAPCARVASFGGLRHFRSENAPPGATLRCTDGCPARPACAYDAHHYVDKHRSWLGMVMDKEPGADEDTVVDWLRRSPWGRCVYFCGNDALDDQQVSLEFENGVGASLVMTAFDSGREWVVRGTEGVLRMHSEGPGREGPSIELFRSPDKPVERIDLRPPRGAYRGHLGGDAGLIEAFAEALDGRSTDTDLQDSVEGHLIAFAAEEARLNGRILEMRAFRSERGFGLPVDV